MNPILSKILWGQLQSLGLFTEKKGRITDLKVKTGLQDLYNRWIEASLVFFTEEKLLEYEGDSYFIFDTTPVDMDIAWKEWELNKKVWLKEPSMKAQVILVEATLRALPSILTGQVRATDIIFPNSSIELIEGIYKNNIVADYFNEVLSDTLTAFIDTRLKQDPSAQIQIFEIGAGSGGTSELVFRKLEPYKHNVKNYCYTDISKSFLFHAEKEYGPDTPYLTYKLFNTEQPVSTQEIVEGSYDIVIATNVLHATKNIRHTVGNVKSLLKKNGLILLNEISMNSLFNHLTFGLLEGWWQYEDSELRITGCPGLYADSWKMVLEDEGFQSIFFPAQHSHHLGQQIIVAESDGLFQKTEEEKIEERILEQSKTSSGIFINEKLNQVTKSINKLETDKTYLVEAHVKEILIQKMSEALKMDPSLINSQVSFADYGLDSILGVNLIQSVSKALEIELQTTDIFDYSSINQLTNYIVSEYQEAIASTLDLFDNQMKENKKNSELNQEQKGVPNSLLLQEDVLKFEENKNGDISKEPIAIIGISGRFAQSQNPEELWKHLVNGDDLVEEISRWDLSKYYSENKKYCNYGSLLDDIDKFDPFFFNISGIEATYMDPQQRIFLEEAWNALENAGYAGGSVSGTNCGIYVGCAAGDYHTLFAENPPPQALWGSLNSAIAARISYYLNLQGPAITIDTACSSSLVAIHLACQSLWSRETSMALAGGIYIQTTPQYHLLADRAGMLSQTGHCYTFDNRADGMVPGEGTGAVVLKRLQDAIADGDNIYGVIRGSAINQDGTTNGITAPSLKSQEKLEQYVYDTFQINPEHIQMVEAHGTGTKLGDPIEYQAISRAFRKYTDKKEFSAIGSMKTNIGHAQLASGIAGLLKILLSLKYKKIPPSLHFESGNTNIQFKDSPFYINTGLKEWEVEPGIKRCAAISSFGATGTNAHMVIEEAPQINCYHGEKPGYLIVLSANTFEQLRQQAEQLADFCDQHQNVDCGNMSFTLLLGRKHFKHRLACVIRNQTELVKYLTAWLNSGKFSQVYVSNVHESEYREQPSLKRYGNQCIQESQYLQNTNKYLEQMAVIADLYIQGYRLSFDQLFVDGKYTRIPLPTYPFSRERYWVDEKDNVERNTNMTDVFKTGTVLHPLLHQNVSDLMEQRFRSKFTGEETFLAYCKWNGKRNLPETAYLEMARAAVELAIGTDSEAQPGIRFRNIFWLNTIALEEQSIELNIGLYPEEDGEISYEIYTEIENGEEERNICYRGSAVLSELENAPVWDLSKIQDDCGQKVLHANQFYDLLSSVGLEFDGVYCNIETIFIGEEKVLAKLSISPEVINSPDQFVLHPSVLDAALQASIGLTMHSGRHKALTPKLLEEMEIFSNPDSDIWAFIRYGDYEKQRIDIDICDRQGKVQVRMKGLTNKTETDYQENTRNAEGEEEFELMTFEEVWKEQAWVSASDKMPQMLICFLSDPEKQQAVLTATQMFSPLTKVIFIAHNHVSKHESEQIYRVDRKNPDTYQSVFQSILEKNGKADAVLYLWPLEDSTCIQDYTPILYMLKSMAATNFKAKRILLAGTFEDGLNRSFLESWIGFERSLGMIMPDIEVSAVYSAKEKEKNVDLNEWVKRLLHELQTAKAHSVLYQKNKRHIYQVNPVTLQAGNSLLGSGKTYIITGGLGKIGYQLAEFIARKSSVNLVLVGRSALDYEKQNKLDSLKILGSQVSYIQADVSSREDMKKVVLYARQQYGSINGVIHGAGVLSNQTIFEKNEDDFQKIISSKTTGAVVIDDLLAKDKLDFMCYFSSSSAIIGDFGSCDYSVGNRFLMAYGAYRNELVDQGKRHGKTIVINWPLWKTGGMGLDNAEGTKMYLKASGQRFLEGKDGLEMFEKILSQNHKQVLILNGQPSRVERFLGLQQYKNSLSESHMHDLDVPTTLKKGRRPGMKGLSIEQCLEWDLKEIISALLKVSRDKLDLKDNFTEFGFDSLILTEFSGLLSDHFSIEITPALFYGYPTLEQLIQYFMTNQLVAIQSFYEDEEFVNRSVDSEMIPVLSKPKRVKAKKSRFVAASTVQESLEPIAIIGMSGRFPQARNIDELWKILLEGRDVVTEKPEERFLEGDEQQLKWKGGWIPGVDEFDPKFFGISPREAETMDPRQRLLLQESWKALEDAGYGAEKIEDSKIGMYVGVESGDYQYLTGINAPITANHDGVLAARLAYFLNFKGPNMAINTACSSGLVGAHQACQSLRNNECDIALVAGVNLILTSGTIAAIHQAGMLSEDGKCYAFDNRANGMVPGEAVAVLALKRLSQAEADGDSIYAVIKGSGVNYDGKTNGITAPSGVAQADLLKTVYEKYQVNPEDIEYIVTHGTGTKLGDPVEVNALSDVFKNYTKKQKYCALTSVKTNLGHTFAASGLVSLISLVESICHKIIPASLHFEEENRFINWKESPFYVNKNPKNWSDESGKRRTGAVSAFGMSGTNAHMVVESYISEKPDIPKEQPPFYILPISAKTEEGVREKIRDLITVLEKNDSGQCDLERISYTLMTGRHHFNQRFAIVTSEVNNAIHILQQVSGNESLPILYHGKVPRDFKGRKGIYQYINDLLVEIRQNNVDRERYFEILQVLADFYCQGYEIPWKHLYGEMKPYPAHLPTYPFARGRYWVKVEKQTSSTTKQVEIQTDVLPEHSVAKDNHSKSNKPYGGLSKQLDLKGETRTLLESDKSLPALLRSETNKSALITGKPVITLSLIENEESQTNLVPESSAEVHNKIRHVSRTNNLSKEVLYQEILESLARALGVETREIDVKIDFIDMGLDSIISVEWIQEINKKYGISLKVNVIYEYPKLGALVKHLMNEISQQEKSNSNIENLDVPIIQHVGVNSALSLSAAAVEQNIAEDIINVTNEMVVQDITVDSNISQSELQEELIGSLAEALGMDKNEVDLDTHFIDMGLDSIIGVEWIQSLNKKYGTDLNANVIYDYPNIRSFVKFMENQWNIGRENKVQQLSTYTKSSLDFSLKELIRKVHQGELNVEEADKLIRQLQLKYKDIHLKK